MTKLVPLEAPPFSRAAATPRCKETMHYQVLACDYDGTVARDGLMNADTAAALARLRASGRRIVLVTGRRLEELLTVCPDLGPFDLVVAENGAILYTPSSREAVTLAEPPPPGFVEALRDRGVTDQAVLETIQDMELDLQVVFNKGAVMILPADVDKASGLAAALARLGLSPADAVGIGDAENDHALLGACACGVAVANALPALRERADLVTTADNGAGVAELCERLRATDLEELALPRHDRPRLERPRHA
jgi:hydroxymethylpyrimidine pyrophosphatase-like HAD family hydrolase